MTDPSRSYCFGPWLFGRALGVVAALAFVSMAVQVDGLIGPRGLAPAEGWIRELRSAGIAPSDYPSLFWLDASSATIHAVVAIGIAASLALSLGLLAGPSSLVAFACYLSLVNGSFPFTAFQWDTLLLESLFLGAAVLPWGLRDRPGSSTSRPVARFAVAFLLARLLFRSGYVKLASGDPSWLELTALEVHYETQPLPSPLSFYAHALPAMVHRASAIGMFAVELAFPFLLAVPRAAARRALAFGAWALMGLIALTGNYGFFNVLTAALALVLLDDAVFRRLGRWVRRAGQSAEDADGPPKLGARDVPAAALIAVAVVVFVAGTFGSGAPFPRLRPWCAVNNYGLFAVMTTERPEIVLEASDDGRSWREIPFRYKPGRLDRSPSFSAPHMPRLDWQMWFAALGRFPESPWLVGLMRAIRDGGPDEVLALLADDPIVRSRPRYVRAVLYDYRFVSPAERARTGRVWRRERRRLYAPVVGPETP